jgi:hypothetical protein
MNWNGMESNETKQESGNSTPIIESVVSFPSPVILTRSDSLSQRAELRR